VLKLSTPIVFGSRSGAPGLLGRSKAERHAFCLLGYVSLISLCLAYEIFSLGIYTLSTKKLYCTPVYLASP